MNGINNKKVHNNTAIGILVILVGVGILATIVLISWTNYKNTPRHFNTEKKALAEKLYKEVSEYDYVNEYPQSPEDVVDLYTKMTTLLYGNLMVDTVLVEEILSYMQFFYSSEILDNNSFETQVSTVIKNYNTMVEKGVNTIETDIQPPVFTSFNNNFCSMKVTEFTNIAGNAYWLYFLEKTEDTDQWKIYSMVPSNEHFELLNQ